MTNNLKIQTSFFLKRVYLVCFCAMSLTISFASCGNEAISTDATKYVSSDTTHKRMKIKIGTTVFTARLQDNATAAAFSKLLPLTVNMVELNGNEKYADLPAKLVANAVNPGSIQTGDLMLYGSSTLVLFYKSLSTSYAYTRIGRIEDAKGLAQVLGSGNVKVSFELE